MSVPLDHIRNFSIVAHIDHGKSTLADRLIQLTGGLEAREMKEQVLDSMDIERERGITIKAQTVRLTYQHTDGETYILNLIDTPGHVDFAYEVSRSLAAVEGSLLVVDASQGVEAQTLANVYHAMDANHELVVVLNKIDLPAAEPERIKQQIEDVIGIDAENAVEISAKSGLNIDKVLAAIVERLPAPKGDINAPLKALLVDSWYDTYLGVVVLIRVIDGTVKKGQKIRMMNANAAYELDRVGVFTPKLVDIGELGPGEIGFFTASIKEVADTNVGDTITDDRRPTATPFPGFRPAQPVVFCGLFPVDASDFEELRAAIHAVHAGGTFFSPAVVKRLSSTEVVAEPTAATQLEQLTPRERDVLGGVARGLTNKAIAAELGISRRTVEAHRESLMRKLHIHSVAGLTRFALEAGVASDS